MQSPPGMLVLGKSFLFTAGKLGAWGIALPLVQHFSIKLSHESVDLNVVTPASGTKLTNEGKRLLPSFQANLTQLPGLLP